jgi:hypothetical protein
MLVVAFMLAERQPEAAPARLMARELTSRERIR